MTANSDTKVYNGQKQSVSGYTGAPEGADFSDIKVGATGKDANTYPATFPEGTVGKVDATGKYIVVKAIDGSLTISKRPVTLTSETLSKEYDGTALVNGETPLATEEGWVEGEGANYNFTGSVTLPGATAPNAYTYTAKEGTDFNNYSISYNEGQLSITSKEAKYEVQVTVNSGNKVYDGETLTVSGFVGETENGIPVTADGKTYYVKGLSASATGSNVSDSTSVNATGTAQVVDEAGNDVTSEFQVTVNPGTLTINKRPVTLTSETLSKEYDGTALVNGETPLATEEGWVEGEGANYNFTGSVTLPGATAPNAYTYTAKEGTDFNNYSISYNEGQLSITSKEAKYEVQVTVNSGNKVYDGETLTVSGFVGETENGIPVTADGKTYYVKGLSASATGSNVSDSTSVNATGTAQVVDEAGNDVTSEFKVTVNPGSLTITKRPVTLTSATLEKTYDGTALVNADAPNHGVTINENKLLVEEGWVDGEGATYTFDGTQTLVGSSNNKFSYELKKNTKAENYTITKTEGTLTVTDDDVDTDKVITKTHEGREFALGDTITFTIKVKNIYDKVKTITITEQEGVTITGESVFENVEPGEEVTTTAKYVVREQDILEQNFHNTATASFFGGKSFDGEDDATVEEVKPVFKATKVITEEQRNATFGVDDTVLFKIIVENTGNVTLNNVTVGEELEDATIKAGAGYRVDNNVATIASLAPKTTVVVYAEYTVKQTDVDDADLVNTAIVNAKDPEGKDLDSQKPSVNVPTDEKAPDMVAKKEIANPEAATGKDGKFKVGDTVEFNITVTNTGNVTLKGITVEEGLANAIIDNSAGYTVADNVATIASLAPNKSVAVKAHYVVTQEDIDLGKLTNVATVKEPGSDDPKKPVVPVPTEDPDPSYTVVKTLTNLEEATGTRTAEDGTETKAFKAGETAKFDITVKNTGNVTLTDIEVKDILAGAVLTADKGYDLTEAGVAKIAALAPEDEVVIKAEYVVTQTDVDNGGTQNTVTATGKNPGETPVDPDPIKPEPIPTEDQKPSYTVVKTLSNQDEATGTKTVNGQTVKAFKVGETAKFDIVVTNTGNVTLNDIVVTEGLADAKIVSGNGYKVVDGKAVIDKLSVGTDNAVTVKAEYEITQEDVENGEITNTVTAEAKDPGEKTVDPEPINPEPVPTEDKNPAIKITKVVSNTSADPDGYAEAEKIEYTIQAENIGNITLDNVVITDEMTGDKWEVGTLTPQNPFSEEYKTSYEVKQSDILIGTVTNTAEVQGTSRVAEERVEERQADLKELSVEPIKLTDNADDYTVQDSATVVSQTVKKSSALQVTKTVTSKGSTITVDGKDVTGYRVGDTIEYNIHVKNTGNLTLINVVVNDVPTLATGSPNGSIVIAPSTDNTYTVDGSKATIATLTPGAEVDIKASYLVMAGDGTLKGNKLSNAAFVTGTSPDKDNPQPGDSSKTDPAPIEPEPDEGNGAMEGSITVTKMITTSDGKTPKDGVDAVIKVGLYDNASFSGQPIKTNTITISRGTSGNTVFDELDNTAGTVYYVAELDENGKPIVGGSAHLKGYGVPSYSANCKAGINPTTTKDTAASIVNPLAADSTGNGDKNDNSNSSTTSNNSNTSTSTKAAKTGDNTNMMLYWMLLGMAILAGCVAVVYRKRKER